MKRSLTKSSNNHAFIFFCLGVYIYILYTINQEDCTVIDQTRLPTKPQNQRFNLKKMFQRINSLVHQFFKLKILYKVSESWQFLAPRSAPPPNTPSLRQRTDGKRTTSLRKSAQSTQKAAKSQKHRAAALRDRRWEPPSITPSARSRKSSSFPSLKANPVRTPPRPPRAPPRSFPTVKPNRTSAVFRAQPRDKKV